MNEDASKIDGKTVSICTGLNSRAKASIPFHLEKLNVSGKATIKPIVNNATAMADQKPIISAFRFKMVYLSIDLSLP
jgi:hypothetical protein